MNTDFKIKDFQGKLKSARADVPDIDALRKLPRVPALTFFRIGTTLFSWLPFDRTPDDGVSSIACEAAPKQAPGRYRRVSAMD